MNKELGFVDYLSRIDDSNIFYSGDNSLVQYTFLDSSEKNINISNENNYLRNDSWSLSFKTNNFNTKNNVITFDKKVLGYIAQFEKESRDKIILQYANEIRILIKNDEFLDGELSNSELYMIDAYKQGNLDYVIDAIMYVYSNNLLDKHMLEGILSMIASVPYDIIFPKGQIMAMGLFVNKELSVRDKAIQCFERWNSKKGLNFLKSVNCDPKWLQKYVEKVIMYIERDGIE